MENWLDVLLSVLFTIYLRRINMSQGPSRFSLLPDPLSLPFPSSTRMVLQRRGERPLSA